MSNPFKYFKDKKEIWSDIPEPKHFEYTWDEVVNTGWYKKKHDEWVARPHFTVSHEPDWEDGKIVEPNVHFRWQDKYECSLNWNCDCENGGECRKPKANPTWRIAIPLPKEPETFYYCQHDIENDNGKCEIQCPHCKAYYLPLEKQMKEQQDIPMDKDGGIYLTVAYWGDLTEEQLAIKIMNIGGGKEWMIVSPDYTKRKPQSPKEEKES